MCGLVDYECSAVKPPEKPLQGVASEDGHIGWEGGKRAQIENAMNGAWSVVYLTWGSTRINLLELLANSISSNTDFKDDILLN